MNLTPCDRLRKDLWKHFPSSQHTLMSSALCKRMLCSLDTPCTPCQQHPQSSRPNSRPSQQLERSFLSRRSTSFRLKFARCCLSPTHVTNPALSCSLLVVTLHTVPQCPRHESRTSYHSSLPHPCKIRDASPRPSHTGIRLRRDSWNMTALTQKCTVCPSLAAAALEA